MILTQDEQKTLDHARRYVERERNISTLHPLVEDLVAIIEKLLAAQAKAQADG